MKAEEVDTFLAGLFAEQDAIKLELDKVNDRRAVLVERHDRLEAAKDAVEVLRGRGTAGRDGDRGPTVVQRRPSPLADTIAPSPTVQVGDVLDRYFPRGGGGKRLRSTAMVADLVEDLDRVVSREELKEAFFHRYPKERLEPVWSRPDNAFSNAVARAVGDGLILELDGSRYAPLTHHKTLVHQGEIDPDDEEVDEP